MTDRQTSSSEEIKIETSEELLAEQQLLPRLKFMGLLLLFFSGCALCYSLFFTAEINSELDFATTLEQEGESYELLQVERFDAYIVAISFAFVGSLSLFIAWNRQKKFVTRK